MNNSIKHKWLSIWKHSASLLLDFNDAELCNKYFCILCFQDAVEKLFLHKHAEKTDFNWIIHICWQNLCKQIKNKKETQQFLKEYLLLQTKLALVHFTEKVAKIFSMYSHL